MIISRIITIAILLLLFIDYTRGQGKIVFEINGRANFTQPDEYITRDTLTGYSSIRLDDTTVVRMYSNYIHEFTNDYRPNSGYDINGLFTVKLSNRFSLRTGIGLQFWSYSYGTGFDLVEQQVYNIDTIYQEITNPNPGGGIVSCDIYENSYSDVAAGISDRIHQEMINLSIPADIGYDVIPGKLAIRAGGYFHTPLYAAAQRSYVRLERTTVDTITHCKYVRVDEKNTATAGISNFQWGFSSWITYNVLPHLQLEVGIRKQISDVYVKDEYQFYSFDSNSYKPLTFSAGASYKFYKEAPAN